MSSPTQLNSAWVRFRSAVYLRGRGLTYGVGPDPLFPDKAASPGRYSLQFDTPEFYNELRKNPTPENIFFTKTIDTNLDIIAKNSLDYGVVGSRAVPGLPQVIDKLKIGAHLILHLTGSEKAEDLIGLLGQWQTKISMTRDGQFLGVYKLLGRTKTGVLPLKPILGKRALIARYGAIGDMIILSPLIRTLKEDGYHVTLNITPYCAEILKYNPYVDNIILQETDVIPNQDLGGYWHEWMQDYDKYISLSESLEGRLLRVEGRPNFYTSKAHRHETCNINYFDYTMERGGYPDRKGLRGELYFSKDEEKDCATFMRAHKDKFVILWALKGSSHHKIYPLLEPLLKSWLPLNPNVLVVFAGGENEKQYQFEHPQTICMAGQVPLRNVLCMTKHVDLVIGPETSITNAAGCFSTPKITFLTHSTHENLCKYWENDYCLEPENIACYPCHQLHYSLESCPTSNLTLDPTKPPLRLPACSVTGVLPNRLAAQIESIMRSKGLDPVIMNSSNGPLIQVDTRPTALSSTA